MRYLSNWRVIIIIYVFRFRRDNRDESVTDYHHLTLCTRRILRVLCTYKTDRPACLPACLLCRWKWVQGETGGGGGGKKPRTRCRPANDPATEISVSSGKGRFVSYNVIILRACPHRPVTPPPPPLPPCPGRARARRQRGGLGRRLIRIIRRRHINGPPRTHKRPFLRWAVDSPSVFPRLPA